MGEAVKFRTPLLAPGTGWRLVGREEVFLRLWQPPHKGRVVGAPGFELSSLQVEAQPFLPRKSCL